MAALTPSVVNALTFDVEDYFHVSAFDRVVARSQWDSLEHRVDASTERVLTVLADLDVRATFFVLGWVADRFPGLVRRIAAAGHELASHGYGHRLVYELTPEEFRQDLRRSRLAIESAVAAPIVGYRAPSYSITMKSLWALDVLVEEGFAYDASIFPIHHDRYGIPDAPRHPYRIDRAAGRIWEIPPSTVRCLGTNLPVAGGGYFRLLPYGWTRWGIGWLNRREERPAIFYLHPWELDPAQPRLGASGLSRFRHYRNLEQTELRLRRLLRDFRFGTVSDALAAPALHAAPSLRPAAFPALRQAFGG